MSDTMTQGTEQQNDAQATQAPTSPVDPTLGTPVTPASLQKYLMLTNFIGESLAETIRLDKEHGHPHDVELVLPVPVAKFLFRAVVSAFDRALLAGGARPEHLSDVRAAKVKAAGGDQADANAVLVEIDQTVDMLEALAARNPAFNDDLASAQKQADKARAFLATLPADMPAGERVKRLIEHATAQTDAALDAQIEREIGNLAEAIISASKNGTLAGMFGGKQSPSTVS